MVFKIMCVVCLLSKGASFHMFFLFLHVRSYVLIQEFESLITGFCSPHVVSLCGFAYYVVG